MAAISVRDIPDGAWESFKASSQSEGQTAEAKIRMWIIREAREWELQGDQEKIVGLARWLRRDDGKPLHGSLTFKIAVVERDWEAIRHMAPQQYSSFHGTPSLDAADWAYLRGEASKDGVEL